MRSIGEFNKMVLHIDLVECGYKGLAFTWCNNRKSGIELGEELIGYAVQIGCRWV